MSNYLAIAAVTAALRHLLDSEVNGDLNIPHTEVTVQPLDKARGDKNSDQINLFLYQTNVNAAWRNIAMPNRGGLGEAGYPPLPLELGYLVTAYGKDNEDISSHRLLGKAMSILLDHPILMSDEIESNLPGNDLYEQIEKVKISYQPMSVEEISKLWTAFQAQYRISASYQVSVVLIESNRDVKVALPVLRRGAEDKGPEILGLTTPGLSGVKLNNRLPSGRLGDDLRIEGQHLDIGEIKIRFSNIHLKEPVEIPPKSEETENQPNVHPPDTAVDLLSFDMWVPERSKNRLKVLLLDASIDPLAFDRWVPGFYTVALIVNLPGLPAWATNEVPFTLASTIIEISPARAPPGDLALSIKCIPRLREGQRVQLLFGQSQVAPVSIEYSSDDLSLPTALKFFIPDVKEGEYVIRLRVDGVDSLPVILTGSPPMYEFDPKQRVIIS
jgi:hypothetical protein